MKLRRFRLKNCLETYTDPAHTQELDLPLPDDGVLKVGSELLLEGDSTLWVVEFRFSLVTESDVHRSYTLLKEGKSRARKLASASSKH